MNLTCGWDDSEATESSSQQLQANQSVQTNGSNLTDQLYNQCFEIAGKEICDAMFRRDTAG